MIEKYLNHCHRIYATCDYTGSRRHEKEKWHFSSVTMTSVLLFSRLTSLNTFSHSLVFRPFTVLAGLHDLPAIKPHGLPLLSYSLSPYSSDGIFHNLPYFLAFTGGVSNRSAVTTQSPPLPCHQNGFELPKITLFAAELKPSQMVFKSSLNAL